MNGAARIFIGFFLLPVELDAGCFGADRYPNLFYPSTSLAKWLSVHSRARNHNQQRFRRRRNNTAYKMAKAVDTDGRVVVCTTHKEKAELKRDQIHAYGRDVRMAASTGSMSARIEPASG